MQSFKPMFYIFACGWLSSQVRAILLDTFSSGFGIITNHLDLSIHQVLTDSSECVLCYVVTGTFKTVVFHVDNKNYNSMSHALSCELHTCIMLVKANIYPWSTIYYSSSLLLRLMCILYIF